MENIRILARETTIDDRRKFRETFFDELRKDLNAPEVKDGSSTNLVVRIAQELKGKSRIEPNLLANLKNALLEGEENLSAFFKVNGALRGLIRELTGNDASKQLSSAGCFCNLSLASKKTCLSITKAAGPYFVINLTSMNKELSILSAWTIGNLAASGEQICRLLCVQGAILKLVNLLRETDDVEVIDAIAYALSFYLRSCGDFGPDVDKEKIIIKIINLNEKRDHCYFLIYLLISNEVSAAESTLLVKLYDDLSGIINNIEEHGESNITSVTCIIRALANCCNAPNNCDLLLKYFNQTGCFEIMLAKLLFHANSQLKADLMWLLGNLFNFSTEGSEKDAFFTDIERVIK